MSKSLTTAEVARLKECEIVIEEGLQNFVTVGNALIAIKTDKLYRDTHGTFEAYAKDRWTMTPRHALRLCEAAEVVNGLENRTHVSEINARQANELAKAPVESRAAILEKVATAGKVTAKAIQEAIEVEHPRVESLDEKWKAALPGINLSKSNDLFVSNLNELTGRKFACIYADPPWRYQNQGTRASTDNHYETMTVDEICALPIKDLAEDNAHLHLWTTNAFLFECPKIFAAWGFEFKSSFVWCKTQMGIGNYWRNSHEILLLAVRGSLTAQGRDLKSWAEFPRTKHSAKPEQVRGFIQRISPGPYLELFGRNYAPGWTVFGNEILESQTEMAVNQ